MIQKEISMRPRFFPLTMGLVAVLLTSSCVPTTAAPTVDSAPPASFVPEASTPQPTVAAPADAPASTQSSEVEVLPVPTSRGPKLEATDPASVSLASDQLQLVEFFRFT